MKRHSGCMGKGLVLLAVTGLLWGIPTAGYSQQTSQSQKKPNFFQRLMGKKEEPKPAPRVQQPAQPQQMSQQPRPVQQQPRQVAQPSPQRRGILSRLFGSRKTKSSAPPVVQSSPQTPRTAAQPLEPFAPPANPSSVMKITASPSNLTGTKPGRQFQMNDPLLKDVFPELPETRADNFPPQAVARTPAPNALPAQQATQGLGSILTQAPTAQPKPLAQTPAVQPVPQQPAQVAAAPRNHLNDPQLEELFPEGSEQDVDQTKVAAAPVVQPQAVQPQAVQPQTAQPQVVQQQIPQPRTVQPQVAQPQENQPQVVAMAPNNRLRDPEFGDLFPEGSEQQADQTRKTPLASLKFEDKPLVQPPTEPVPAPGAEPPAMETPVVVQTPEVKPQPETPVAVATPEVKTQPEVQPEPEMPVVQAAPAVSPEPEMPVVQTPPVQPMVEEPAIVQAPEVQPAPEVTPQPEAPAPSVAIVPIPKAPEVQPEPAEPKELPVQTAEVKPTNPEPQPLPMSTEQAELKPVPEQPATPKEKAPAVAQAEEPAAPETKELTPEEKVQLEKQKKREAMLKLLAERKDQHGFKGFCPVVLRNERELINVNRKYSSEFEGVTYHFSSYSAKEQFDADPTKYAPVAQGNDVILSSKTNQVEGNLEYAVWYQDRLYLFESRETLVTFVKAPEKFVLASVQAQEAPAEEPKKLAPQENVKLVPAEEPAPEVAQPAEEPAAPEVTAEQPVEEPAVVEPMEERTVEVPAEVPSESPSFEEPMFEVPAENNAPMPKAIEPQPVPSPASGLGNLLPLEEPQPLKPATPAEVNPQAPVAPEESPFEEQPLFEDTLPEQPAAEPKALQPTPEMKPAVQPKPIPQPARVGNPFEGAEPDPEENLDLLDLK